MAQVNIRTAMPDSGEARGEGLTSSVTRSELENTQVEGFKMHLEGWEQLGEGEGSDKHKRQRM